MSTKDKNSVFVRNLPLDVTKDQLSRLFTEFGPVNGVFIPKDSYTGRSRNYAFVEFKNQDHTERAVKKGDGMAFAGRTLHVSYAIDTRAKSPSPKRNRSRSPRRHGSSTDSKMKTKLSDLAAEKESLQNKIFSIKREFDEARNKNSQYREHIDQLKHEVSQYRSNVSIYLPCGHTKILKPSNKAILDKLYEDCLDRMPSHLRKNKNACLKAKNRIYELMESKYPEVYRCRASEKQLLDCGHRQGVECYTARDFAKGLKQIKCSSLVWKDMPCGHNIQTKCSETPECNCTNSNI